jgi:Transcriptional regulator, AbiEi antitoxin
MGPPGTEALTTLTAAQHGVVGREQLGELEVTRRRLDNLIRRGVLVRPACSPSSACP